MKEFFTSDSGRVLSGIVVSCVVSLVVSWITARAEIKKLERAWAHEDYLDFSKAFEALVTSVRHYVSGRAETPDSSIYNANIARIKVSGSMAVALDELYHVLTAEKTPDRALVDSALNDAINENRNIHGKKKRGK